MSHRSSWTRTSNQRLSVIIFWESYVHAFLAHMNPFVYPNIDLCRPRHTCSGCPSGNVSYGEGHRRLENCVRRLWTCARPSPPQLARTRSFVVLKKKPWDRPPSMGSSSRGAAPEPFPLQGLQCARVYDAYVAQLGARRDAWSHEALASIQAASSLLSRASSSI